MYVQIKGGSCMFCGGSMSPNDLDLKIGELKTGDQIIVLLDEGSPRVRKDTVDFIWKVSGYFALTAGGIVITSYTISDLIRTGNHLDDFLVSDQAKAFWAEIQEDFRDGIFPSEPE